MIDISSLSFPENLKTIEYVHVENIWRLMNSSECSEEVLKTYDLMHNDENDEYGKVFLEAVQSEAGFGRYYATGSLIRHRRKLRHFLTNNQYVELDIRASNPSIMLSLVESVELDVPFLRAYVLNRDAFHEHIHEAFSADVWQRRNQHGDQYSPKLFINSYLNGSREIFDVLKEDNDFTIQLTGLLRDIRNSIGELFGRFDNVPYNKNSHCPRGSKVSMILLTCESYIIVKCIELLAEMGHINTQGDYYECGYGYDGIFFQQRDGNVDEIIVAFNRFTTRLGFKYVTFKAKELEEYELSVPTIRDGEERVPRLGTIITTRKSILRYPTGQGKTYRSLNYACYNFERVLVLVHRQTLALDIKKNYPQFTCYIESGNERGRINADKQIICINSLYRLGTQLANYEIIIIDEISSVLKQMIQMEMTVVNMQFVEALFKKDDLRIICMDALIAEKELSFLSKYGNFQLCSPDILQTPTRVVHVIENSELLLSMFKRDALCGMRVWIAHSMNIEKMEGVLQSLQVPYLHVTRFNKHEVTIESLQQYNVLAFSPCIDAGVDITFYDNNVRIQHFQRGYGLFYMGTSTPQQAVQMLGRDRACTEFYVSTFGRNNKSVLETRSDFKNYVKERGRLIQFYNLTTFIDDEFNVNLVENFQFDLAYLCNQTVMESKRHKYYMYLKFYFCLNGWKTTLKRYDEEEIDNLIDKAKKEGMYNEYCSISESPIRPNFEPEDKSREATHSRLCERITEVYRLEDKYPDASNYEDENSYEEASFEKRRELLLCLNESFRPISFDYIKHWRENRSKYYVQREIFDMFMGKKTPPHFQFEYSGPSFHEIVNVVFLIIRNLGFNANRSEIALGEYNEFRVPKRVALKGKHFTEFLSDKSGLHIVKTDSQARLVNLIASKNLEDGVIMNDETLFPFHSPDEKVTCNRCFKQHKLKYPHRCRNTIGYTWVLVAGVRQQVCVYCNEAVVRNLKRHSARCRH